MSAALLSQPVVIDNGTGVVKAGMAGGDRPSVIFSSTCGRAKHMRMMPGGASASGVALKVPRRRRRSPLATHFLRLPRR
jgi:actin-related protein